MQSIIQRLFQIAFRIVETVAPTLAGKWAIKLFFTPLKPKRPRREEALIKDATIQKVSLQESFDKSITQPYFVTYSWGKGPVVLLVHGWGGRGSQVATLAQPLVDSGYRVVTFDALAHGDSPGKQTNILEFKQIIQHIEAMEGGFYAIIGHSFGGVAAALAVSEGVKAEKLATIGTPASMEFVFDQFASIINASGSSIEKLTYYIEHLAQRRIDEFSLTNIVTKLNQPGLIIHDKNDREVSHTEALALAKQWTGSELVVTEGLGHRRILRDEAVISKIIGYIATDEDQESSDIIEAKSTESQFALKLPLDVPVSSVIV